MEIPSGNPEQGGSQWESATYPQGIGLKLDQQDVVEKQQSVWFVRHHAKK
jgi:hypothetical protein